MTKMGKIYLDVVFYNLNSIYKPENGDAPQMQHQGKWSEKAISKLLLGTEFKYYFNPNFIESIKIVRIIVLKNNENYPFELPKIAIIKRNKTISGSITKIHFCNNSVIKMPLVVKTEFVILRIRKILHP